MTKPRSIDTLAVQVCQAVRDVRDEDQAWIAIDCLNEFLRLDDVQTIDVALAFASAKGWLSIGGRPAHSVLLERERSVTGRKKDFYAGHTICQIMLRPLAIRRAWTGLHLGGSESIAAEEQMDTVTPNLELQQAGDRPGRGRPAPVPRRPSQRALPRARPAATLA